MASITYRASATLSDFLHSDAFVRCVVGPVGSGKSSAMVMEILLRAARQEPDKEGNRRTRFAVIRNTYSQLRDTTRKTFEKWIPARLGRWHEQSFTFEIDHVLGDGTRIQCEVLFRALDRPEDVRKLLSLELTGAYINEAREIPKNVLDVLEGRVGRFPSRDEGGATWSGIWMDTNPWHGGHWGAKLFARGLPGYECFRQPGGRAADAENVENLPDGYYDRLAVGKDREYVRVYIDGEDASGAVGSIYGAWLSELRARGGISAFDHPCTDVFTSWDLGRRDSTAIWFWRVNARGGIDVLDYYENSGQGLGHYFGVVDGKGYSYKVHWLPHDAGSETLATRQTVFDQCVEHFRGTAQVKITPSVGIDDGIAAVRWLMEQPTTSIHERCGVPVAKEYSGIDALEEYRYEWDEANQCFSANPLHNWASHCFVPSTEVLTRNGACQIGMLPSHGEVMTPCGWKPYRSPRMTRRNAPLVEVTFSDGHSVKCTPDHLFLTDCGWRSAESLAPNTVILSSSTRSPKCSTGASTESGLKRPISSAGADRFTDTLGRWPSEISPKGATSTTGTRTPPTIGSTTLSAWTARSTSRAVADDKRTRVEKSGSLRSLGKLLRRGIEALRAAYGTLVMLADPRHGPSGPERTGLVRTAARRSRAWSGPMASFRSIVATRARPERSESGDLTITRVRHTGERSDVWDLTVPGVECFALANGAFVHNCADAARYMGVVARNVASRMTPPEPPVKPKFVPKRPTLDDISIITPRDNWRI